jgi:hypothetical protein
MARRIIVGIQTNVFRALALSLHLIVVMGSGVSICTNQIDTADRIKANIHNISYAADSGVVYDVCTRYGIDECSHGMHCTWPAILRYNNIKNSLSSL